MIASVHNAAVAPAIRRRFCALGLLAALLTGGCAPPAIPPEPIPVPVEPADKPEPESFPEGPVDFPALPSGAGAIDEDAPREFTVTKSGLRYRILRQGTGKKPTVLNRVKAHYRGWLDDGKEFDSSYKRGEPSVFPLNAVVSGWREGIPYCAEGGMIELIIPSKLGYGPNAKGIIPPNAKLHFLVELVSVMN